uniref:F-box domain-containing protein n=1 Tax=Tetranychus urticae TaxID=32264 RepID=T1JRV2_TETUR
MFINELPDDCLLIIFSLIKELDDLLNCYKVCNKWSHLIAERTRKVKYLVDRRDWWDGVTSPSYSFDYAYYRPQEPIDATCLSITDLPYRTCIVGKNEVILTLFKRIISLYAKIHQNDRDESIFQYCDALEMLSTGHIDPVMKKIGGNIKQLHLWNYTLNRFKEDAHYFPNIERLSISNNEGSPDWLYDGPIFKRLKIVEMQLSSYDGTDTNYAFQFMDSCPNLQSAHIKLDSNHIHVDESLKHESLQDLVLHFYSESVAWNELKRLFIKYPNLKHLALRNHNSLVDGHVEHLVRILPNLVLFDIRGCPGVTQKSADYVEDYCKLYGRLIKFYFDKNRHELGLDWPQLSTKREKISQGFDFMKHCFLKSYLELPTFLVSSED